MTSEEKQALIDGLKTKHGQIFELASEDSPYGLVIVRRLTKLEYRRVKEQRDDESKKNLVDELVATLCIVYPDQAGVQKLIDEYPPLAAAVMGKVLEVSGAEKLTAKKL